MYSKLSEFDIIEVDEVRRIEEKERRERQRGDDKLADGKQAKELRKSAPKDSGVFSEVTCVIYRNNLLLASSLDRVTDK